MTASPNNHLLHRIDGLGRFHLPSRFGRERDRPLALYNRLSHQKLSHC